MKSLLMLALLVAYVYAETQLEILARQTMLQQFYVEERIRSEGCSGVKQVRHNHDGTRPYHTDTHIGSGVASTHDHSNSVRSLGMGEFVAVLNGVEFMTRHNDYLLKRKSFNNSTYGAMEDVPLPPVPHSVLALTEVQDQVAEMQKYFEAFAKQDITIRDYRPYFKPVISYMEGFWIKTGDEVEEPFFSERHWIAADTWRELEDRWRFMSYGGGKENLENLAFLPKHITGVKDGEVEFGQWTYRILCHELERDLLPDRLQVVDDLATRIVSGLSLEEFAETRDARFSLNPTDSPTRVDQRYRMVLLDELMREVPGLDSYGADLRDETYGFMALDPDKAGGEQNVAYYHAKSWFDVKDAMGQDLRHRGFSDEALYMAASTQEKIVGMKFDNCLNDWANRTDCMDFQQKWSYAIPMEIIYMTPLGNWNPYNIEYNGWEAEPGGDIPLRNGADGSWLRPFNGSNSKHYFHTPAEFFSGPEIVRPADTTGGEYWVLDRDGVKHKMRASGIRTLLPTIPGIDGHIRQRYPIMPVHGEGSTVWKELAALKDIVLNAGNNRRMFYKK